MWRLLELEGRFWEDVVRLRVNNFHMFGCTVYIISFRKRLI